MAVALPTRLDVVGSVANRGAGLEFDPSRQRGALQELQFWNWGQDIRRVEGNLLLNHGFERRRPPAGQIGSSAYRLDLPHGARLDLWGFGALYRTPNGSALYLPRARQKPARIDQALIPDHIWEPSQVPMGDVRGTEADLAEWRHLQAALFRWIASYERWVLEIAGLAYRRRCLVGRRRMVVPAEQLAIAWDNAADWATRTIPRRGANRTT